MAEIIERESFLSSANQRLEQMSWRTPSNANPLTRSKSNICVTHKRKIPNNLYPCQSSNINFKLLKVFAIDVDVEIADSKSNTFLKT